MVLTFAVPPTTPPDKQSSCSLDLGEGSAWTNEVSPKRCKFPSLSKLNQASKEVTPSIDYRVFGTIHKDWSSALSNIAVNSLPTFFPTQGFQQIHDDDPPPPTSFQSENFTVNFKFKPPDSPLTVISPYLIKYIRLFPMQRFRPRLSMFNRPLLAFFVLSHSVVEISAFSCALQDRLRIVISDYLFVGICVAGGGEKFENF